MFVFEISFVGPVLLGAAVGTAIYLTGVGAGVLLIPALVLLFGLDTSTAIGTASIFSVFSKVSAVASHYRAGHVAMPLLLRFLWWALPAAVIAALALALTLRGLPAWGPILQLALQWAVFGATVIAAATMWSAAAQTRLGRLGNAGSLSVGVLFGCTGVGGGALIVPLLASRCTVGLRPVIGTATLAGLILSLATGAILGTVGQIAWNYLGWMALGSLLLVRPSRMLFRHLDDRVLAVLVLVIIFGAALAIGTKAAMATFEMHILA
jgi:uncharacterized protein